ncbi:MmyB family transcriptional regulator [Gordonia jinghuaiqii]|uniref:MmyB family transcriptional regulator n=1 Tax=Gordonia jinghuaiqii TaxID=2758710 RepID=UPI002948BD88|nr:transcriptional regulator [Gordonia jinghuaiqii]
MLQLNGDHVSYLMSLIEDKPRRARRRRRRETVPSGMRTLLSSMSQPAYIEGRYFDVLASNALAVALSPRFAIGGNQLRDMFLDPAEQSLYPEWEHSTQCLVANLRQSVGGDVDDPRFVELVGELSLASPRFRELWAQHDIKVQFGAPMHLDHPEVGEMTLNRERLSIDEADGLKLVVYHADPGTENADKLALLASSALPVAHNGADREGLRS